MKDLVPDCFRRESGCQSNVESSHDLRKVYQKRTLAIVPRLLTRSALVIPIPVSRMVRVLASLSGVIRM